MHHHPTLRSFLCLFFLLFAGSLLLAAESIRTRDHANELLTANGSVRVSHVGRAVEIGTYQIQVSVKLGRPDLRLADGTWLYHERNIEHSEATGTLVVRFTNGRVSELSLAGPSLVAALETQARAPARF